MFIFRLCITYLRGPPLSYIIGNERRREQRKTERGGLNGMRVAIGYG